jgi:hypothetical protein
MSRRHSKFNDDEDSFQRSRKNLFNLIIISLSISRHSSYLHVVQRPNKGTAPAGSVRHGILFPGMSNALDPWITKPVFRGARGTCCCMGVSSNSRRARFETGFKDSASARQKPEHDRISHKILNLRRTVFVLDPL